MRRINCTGKVSKVVLAAVLSAGLMLPTGMAMADPAADDVADASFKLSKIWEGDVVTAYQIFDTSIDSNNNLVYTKMVADLPSQYDTVDKIAAAANGRDVADAIAAVVIASSTKTVSATADDSETVTLSLDSGYYLVVVTCNSGSTRVYQTLLVDATPDVQGGSYVTRTIDDAKAKYNFVSSPIKYIEGRNFVDHHFVGDEVEFEVTMRVPSYPADATNPFFSITDVPSAGLELDTSSFALSTESGQLSEGVDYSVASNADGSFTFEFSRDFVLSNPGANVTIDYKGTIAFVDQASGKVYNIAYAKFAPNPYDDGAIDSGDSGTVADLTYGFSFRKLASPDNTPLAGAIFTVSDANGNPVTYVDANGEVHTDGQVASDTNGYVYVKGLPEGLYSVSETSVPAGYQKVDDFTVYLDEDSDDDSPATDSVTETNFELVSDKIDAKVGQLPTTGGAGTIALTAGGILLIAGGSVIVLRRHGRDQA